MKIKYIYLVKHKIKAVFHKVYGLNLKQTQKNESAANYYNKSNGGVNIKYLNVDSDVYIADIHAAIWAEREIGLDRFDTMTEAIQKLLTDTEYLFVAINGDSVDFMPLLSIMRSITYIPILIVTGNFTTEKEIAAMDAGADLYARWHEKPEDNIASVMAHVARFAARSQMPRPVSNIIAYKDILIAPLKRYLFVKNEKIELTTKEFDVLYLLMDNPGVVFSSEKIYNQIWSLKYDKYAKAVIWTLMKRLRQRLQIDQHSRNYIRTVRHVGYSYDPQK